MSQDRYIYLIYKELNDTLNDAEQGDLQRWLDESPNHAAQKEEIVEALAKLDATTPRFDIDVARDYAKVAASLGLSGDDIGNRGEATAKTSGNGYIWILIAAFLLGIGAAALYYKTQEAPAPVLRVLNTDDKIQEVQLADGSMIKLNAGSTLEYPEVFDGNTRSVTLHGEAYFDIKRDETRPFVITTAQSSIEVLGTSFNVREDFLTAQTTVAVLSGKVRFTSTHDVSKSIVLNKNQKGTITKDHNVLKEDNENLNALAWESGKLRFKSAPVGEVFGDMAAFYDISIINKSSIADNCTYSMSGQEIALDRLLENMNQIFDFDIERKGDDVIVISGGNCK